MIEAWPSMVDIPKIGQNCKQMRNSLVALCHYTAHETNFLVNLCLWKLESTTCLKRFQIWGIYASIPSESLLLLNKYSLLSKTPQQVQIRSLNQKQHKICVTGNTSQVLTMSNSLILSILVPILTPFVFWGCGYSYHFRFIYIRFISRPTSALKKLFQIIQPFIPWAWVVFVIVYLEWMESLYALVLWFSLIVFWGCAFVQAMRDVWERQKRINEEGVHGLAVVAMESTIEIEGGGEGGGEDC